MALHDVAVQATVHRHRTLDVDAVALLQQAKVGAEQRLLHRRHGVATVLDAHHSEADAIVGNALVYFQLIDKAATEREVDILLVVTDGNDGCHLFYYTAKHIFISDAIFLVLSCYACAKLVIILQSPTFSPCDFHDHHVFFGL